MIITIAESINIMSKTIGPAMKEKDPKPIQAMAIAEAEAGVEKVEFYIDGELVHKDTEAPFEYEVRKINRIRRLIKSRTFKVILYDTDERTAEDSVDLYTVLL